jgi:parallel beta-helix repeat protein
MSITTGTFPGVRIVDMPDLGAVTDSSSVVGEHAGSGRFTAPALRAYATNGYPVSVTWFGAKGDGVTDDTAAINAAMTAGAGGEVWFPKGNYVYGVTGTATTIPANTTLCGAGDGSAIWLTNTGGGTYYAFKIANAGCAVRHLKIENHVTTSGAVGVAFQLEGATDFSADNVTIYGRLNTFPAVQFDSIMLSGQFTNVRISGCRFENCQYAIFRPNTVSSDCKQLVITDNFFADSVGDDIELNSPLGSLQGVTITGNSFTGTKGTAGAGISVGIAAATDVTISGNYFSSPTGNQAIHIEDSSQRIVVSDNIINNFAGSGIQILYSAVSASPPNYPQWLNVSGNVVNGEGGPSSYGIEVAYTANPNAAFVNISGNTVAGCSRGISAGTTGNEVIANNLISGCTTGIFASVPNTDIRDNTLINCATGLNGFLAGSFGSHRFSGVTTWVTSTNGRAGLQGFRYSYGITLAAAGATGGLLHPLGLMLGGQLSFTVLASPTAYVSARYSETYDGTTYASTAVTSRTSGTLTLTASLVNTGGNISFSVSNSGGALPAQVDITYDGVILF